MKKNQIQILNLMKYCKKIKKRKKYKKDYLKNYITCQIRTKIIFR